MTVGVHVDAGARTGRSFPRLVSRAGLWLALLLLVATFLLLSPPPGEGYPGTVPWRSFSLLKPLTQFMSLGGALSTKRGVEVKDLVFHLATGAGLLLVAVRAIGAGRQTRPPPTLRGAWFYAQVLLAAWVGLALASATWSTDPAMALSQAALYGLALAWALAVAWTLEAGDLPRLLSGLVAICAAGATLCLWWFYERNPYHNPGFPIGNPNSLATIVVAAILISVSILVGGIDRWLRRRSLAGRWLPLVGAAAALVPLVWCLELTHSLAGFVGLAAGLVALVFLRGRRWLRWVISVVAIVGMVVTTWWASSPRFEAFISERPTMRLRVYAWRCAAEIWRQRPVEGAGAGAFTRLARGLAGADRRLDPAAFMGDWTAHAHNELFEVFSEIGLVGGVTFVGGYLATLIAALGLVSSRRTDEGRWLVIGHVAALVALMADGMFGVGLRLPGAPPVFYTLLGGLWAACRCETRREDVDETLAALAGSAGGTLHGVLRPRVMVAGVCVLAAFAAGGLGWRNWSGTQCELAADRRAEAGDYASGLALAESAEDRLLDPARRLFAAALAAQCRFELARAAYEQLWPRDPALVPPQAESQTAEPPADREERRYAALDLARQAYYAAAALDQRAPTLLRMLAVAARSAELLADLHSVDDPRRAQQWAATAHQSWREQRFQEPYDVETLLALTEYAGGLSDYLELLRDALRHGFPLPRWLARLEAAAARYGFEPIEQTLEHYVRGVGPIDPQTDLNLLIASMAPETYRLRAAWRALHGDYLPARFDAARAALLYAPLRSRFPELFSVALAEEAEYLLRSDPGQAGEAVALVRAAIDALPDIQPQQRDRMAKPYRERLASSLLAAGRAADAADALRAAGYAEDRVGAVLADLYVVLVETAGDADGGDAPRTRAWLDAALRLRPTHAHAWFWRARLAALGGDPAAVQVVLDAAAAAGVSPADLRGIRLVLCQEFPSLRGVLEATE